MKRTAAILIAVLLISPALGGLRVEAATIRILVLNGKDGKPVQGRTVEISAPGANFEPIVKGITDQQGLIEADTEHLPERIAIYVKGLLLCRGKYIGTSLQSVDDITSAGVVESNDCSPKANRDREPGTLVLFVRRESLSEFFD